MLTLTAEDLDAAEGSTYPDHCPVYHSLVRHGYSPGAGVGWRYFTDFSKRTGRRAVPLRPACNLPRVRNGSVCRMKWRGEGILFDFPFRLG